MSYLDELETYARHHYPHHLAALSPDGRETFLRGVQAGKRNPPPSPPPPAAKPVSPIISIPRQAVPTKRFHLKTTVFVVLGLIAVPALLFLLTQSKPGPDPRREATNAASVLDASRELSVAKGYSPYAPWGIPDADHIIRRDPYYIFGFPAEGKTVRWVCYRVTPGEDAQDIGTSREDPDLNAPQLSKLDQRDGYVAAKLIAPRHLKGLPGYEQQLSYYSIKAMMKAELNQQLWQDLGDLAENQGPVWITVGPVFDALIDPARDPIPTQFFLILAHGQRGAPPTHVTAFLVPNQAHSAQMDPQQFLVSIDDVEVLTGLNFFGDLADQAFEMEKTWIKAP